MAEAFQPLLGSEDEEEQEDEEIDLNSPDKKRHDSPGLKDPVLEAIGPFGPYQAWVCVVGFLMNVVHCWLRWDSCCYCYLIPDT